MTTLATSNPVVTVQGPLTTNGATGIIGQAGGGQPTPALVGCARLTLANLSGKDFATSYHAFAFAHLSRPLSLCQGSCINQPLHTSL